MEMPMIGHRTWRNMDTDRMVDRALHARMAAPWAAVAMIGAFVGGAVLGMFGGKKAAYSQLRGGDYKMIKHHHHGTGTPMCTKKHKHEEHHDAEEEMARPE